MFFYIYRKIIKHILLVFLCFKKLTLDFKLYELCKLNELNYMSYIFK